MKQYFRYKGSEIVGTYRFSGYALNRGDKVEAEIAPELASNYLFESVWVCEKCGYEVVGKEPVTFCPKCTKPKPQPKRPAAKRKKR